MASPADLSGKVIKFEVNSTPVEFLIVSGKVNDDCDQSNYLGTGQSIKATVSHGRLVSYEFEGVLLTTNLPFTTLAPGTAITALKVTLDRGAGSPKFHQSANAEVKSMTHTFDTSTHQGFSVSITADGDYTPPS